MTVREFCKKALSNDYIGFVDNILHTESAKIVPVYELLYGPDIDREIARFTCGKREGYSREIFYVQLVKTTPFQFNSGMEMYECISKGMDLYSKSLNMYVFAYNDAGALCSYTLFPDEVKEILRRKKETNEYWGAYLGVGGSILEESDYDDDEYRYSEGWEKNKLYLAPSLKFCDDLFRVKDWVDTESVTMEFLDEEPKETEIYAVYAEDNTERLSFSDIDFYTDLEIAVSEYNARKNAVLKTTDWKPSTEFSTADVTGSDNSILFERDGVEMYINISTIKVK